jgi:hypothetical protein
VLDRYAPFQDILRPPDASGDVFHGLPGERDRHEVVKMAVIATVTQVLRVASNIEFIKKSPDVAEQVDIEGRGGPEGKGQPVADKWETLRIAAELSAESAAYADPVLRRDLHEVDGGIHFRRVVGQPGKHTPPQAEPNALHGKVHDKKEVPSASNSARYFKHHLGDLLFGSGFFRSSFFLFFAAVVTVVVAIAVAVAVVTVVAAFVAALAFTALAFAFMVAGEEVVTVASRFEGEWILFRVSKRHASQTSCHDRADCNSNRLNLVVHRSRPSKILFRSRIVKVTQPPLERG